jgi:hypothetical protein
MKDKTQKHKRKEAAVLIPLLPKEKAVIRENAETAGMPLAVYMRQVSLGYRPRQRINPALVGDLSKVNADQGRLGGLLKLWLVKDERNTGEIDIRTLLNDLIKTQIEIMRIVKNL